ncbi:MAG: cysteine synthase A, partial [Clostridia bacterium]|nr:cysteine synthase A [Clostridia bacterium]
MKIYSSALQLVGNTPLVSLNRLSEKLGLEAPIIAKVEAFNPAGSSKDRVALNIIKGYEEQGKINRDTVIIEPTSGNTGIGLAFAGAILGYKTVIVMPDSMSRERILAISAYGATVVLSECKKGMAGAIEKAEEIKKQHSSAIILGQFENEDNPLAHYKTTGVEIWNDTDGTVDIFVAGIGTGGTISGTGKYLKEKNPSIKVIGAEPLSSPLLTKGTSGAHKIQGIGANFVPRTYDASVVDKVIAVSDEDAYMYTKLLAQTEGVLAGISSGCAIAAAVEISRQEKNKKIVV